MKIVIFGLSVSSAWGNGHATLHRGLLRALHGLGHEVHFFERDVPYYEKHRDLPLLPYAQLHLYKDWTENLSSARRALEEADAAIVTSYCPDGVAACELIFESTSRLRTLFYDMDTPVTLERLKQGESVPYVPAWGLHQFDLVLSYTGGPALEQLRGKLGARYAATLYGWVDPQIHHRVETRPDLACDLSYLGTYSADRQDRLDRLMIAPAAMLPNKKFVIAGAMYPEPQPWPKNIQYFPHLAPPEHPGFYSSAHLTLSVTRGAMASMGYCPSGRLFEAAACGTAVLSDWWEGLDTFFEPKKEILIGRSSDDAVAALTMDGSHLQKIGKRAKERALDCHTAQHRARRLIDLVERPRDSDDGFNIKAEATLYSHVGAMGVAKGA